MKIVVLGSPGVGKGTYTQGLVKDLGIVHISTGDLFRDNIKRETELGRQAQEYISKGSLVPDEVTVGLVADRLARDDCQKGFILDGFPRTVPQANALKELCEVDVVLFLKADSDVIVRRLGGRLNCKGCSRIYHKTNMPPQQQGVCDDCSGELFQREDDTPETISQRLHTFEQKTAPLIQFYKDAGLLREITINNDYSTHGEENHGRILKIINTR